MFNKLKIKEKEEKFTYNVYIDGKDVSSKISDIEIHIPGGGYIPTAKITIPLEELDIDLDNIPIVKEVEKNGTKRNTRTSKKRTETQKN